MQIFEVPNTIAVPSPFGNHADYEEAEKKYIADLKQYLQMNGYNSEHTGEVVHFPVADGTAMYMVVSMKPLKLLFLPLMDEYQFPYIDRLKAVDILDRIDQRKALERLVEANKKK